MRESRSDLSAEDSRPQSRMTKMQGMKIFFFFFAGAPPSSSKQPPQKGTILDFFNETHAHAAHTHTFLSARGISSMKSRNPIKTTPPTVFKVPLGLVVGVQ